MNDKSVEVSPVSSKDESGHPKAKWLIDIQLQEKKKAAQRNMRIAEQELIHTTDGHSYAETDLPKNKRNSLIPPTK